MGIVDLQSVLPRISLSKGSFSANVITLVAGTGLAQGFTVVATLILARVFTPADFGVFALFIAITSVLSAASSWRFEAAIVLPEKNEDAMCVQALACLILIGMCGLSLIGLVLFRHRFALMLDEQRAAPWLWFIPVSLFLSGLYQILSYWCTRTNQFQSIAIAGLCQSVGAVAGQLGLALLGFGGPTALVLGWIAGQAFGAAVLAVRTARDRREYWKNPLNWASLRAEFIKYKNFPIYNTPYIFAQAFAQQIIVFVLRLFAGVSVVGLFSMARRAVYAPVSLLSSSMRQVFHAKAAIELRSGRLEPFVLRILKLQVLVGTPLLVIFAFEAKPICRLLLGNAWAGVSAYASMLAFLGYIAFVVSWMERIFDVQGRQHVALVWELSRDAIVIGGLACALFLSRNPLIAVGVYVSLDFLCSVVWLLLAFRIANFARKGLWNVGAVCLGSGAMVATLIWTVRIVFHPT